MLEKPSKTKLDFEGIQPKKSQPFPSHPSKATPQKHTDTRCLSNAGGRVQERECWGVERIVVIANCIQLTHVSFTCLLLTTIKTRK